MPSLFTHTLSTECFAESNEKPLYHITSGEVGTDAVTAEYNLRKLFQTAKAWNAYLLLDEADVFIAKRDSTSEMIRNGLVTGRLPTTGRRWAC